MIAIINYKAGNLASVANALERLETRYLVTDHAEELDASDAVIFPGVGHARPAMESLRANNLVAWLRHTKKPVLGICLGMQLFYETSEEGETRGLGIIPGTLKKFDESKGKVPHMGWNTLTDMRSHPLLEGITAEHYFYFVHSYYAPVNEYTIARCQYISECAAVVSRNNFTGVQFHPEKSGEAGEVLIKNFLSMVYRGDLTP